MSSDPAAGPRCPACGRDNRPRARYCRHCGAGLGAGGLDELVGLDDFKAKLAAAVAKARLDRERSQAGLPALPRNLHALFTGNTGTGKTLAARAMARALAEAGLLASGAVREINLDEIERYAGSPSALLQAEAGKLGGGLVIVDEIHRNTRLIGEIVNFLESLQARGRTDTVFVLTGLHEVLDPFFRGQSDDLQRFGLIHHFADYDGDALGGMAAAYLRRHAFSLPDGFEPALRAFAGQCLAANATPYRNGWLVEREIVPRVLAAQAGRLAAGKGGAGAAELSALSLADIPGSGLPAADKEAVLRQLDALVGLDLVKAEIRRLADTVQIAAERAAALAAAGAEGSAAAPPLHIVLRGNPGTGKTTVARMLGRLFRAVGVLPSDRVLEVDRGKLVAQYLGQTAPLVHQVCDRARGGVLFIDEAYTLAPPDAARDAFGQEALDTLLKRMEDDRGQYVVIAAGYPAEMDRFLAANPGLRSRFTTILDLPDYGPAELAAIFRSMAAAQGLELSPAADARLAAAVAAMHAGRGPDFANARAVRSLLEDAVRDQGRRLAALPAAERGPAALRRLEAADIDAAGAYPPPAEGGPA